MRTTLTILAAAVWVMLAVTPTTVDGQTKERTQKVILNIPQMDCGGCELAVKIAAKKVAGVREVVTNSEKRVAEVSYDAAATNVKAIIDAITKNAGFKAAEAKPHK